MGKTPISLKHEALTNPKEKDEWTCQEELLMAKKQRAFTF